MPTILILGDGIGPVSPRALLARQPEPRLQFADGERDVAVLRVHARGLAGGQPKEVVIDVVDYRDLDTGLFAMNRTVGFAVAIGAQLLLSGDIAQPGVLSPARDVPAPSSSPSWNNGASPQPAGPSPPRTWSWSWTRSTNRQFSYADPEKPFAPSAHHGTMIPRSTRHSAPIGGHVGASRR